MQEHTNKEFWKKNEKGLFLPNNFILESKNDKDKKRSVGDYIKWGVNNTGIMVLIPSVLGAIWQIIELASINLAYIRFFSISQIPVDGALILFLGGLLLLIGKMTINFIKFSSEQKIKNLKDEEYLNKVLSKLNRKLIVQSGISLLLIWALFYSIINLYSDMFSSSPIFTIILVFLSISGVMIYISELIILAILKVRISYPDEVSAKEITGDLLNRTRKTLNWLVLPSISFIIFMLVILVKLFSQTFVLPTNFYNIRKLDSAVYYDFNTKNYSVEYFNDKYLFVKVCTIEICNHDLDKEIVIYPMEKVLFENASENTLLEPTK